MTWPLKGIWGKIQPNNVQTQTLSAADLAEYDGIASAPAMKQKLIKRKQSTNKSSDSRGRTRKSSTSPSIMTKRSKEKHAVMMGYTEPDYQVDSDDSHSQQRTMDMRAQYNQYEQGYPDRHQRMIHDVSRKPH